ncbi:sugar phosphate isomerase/epimerase family protein [Halococcus agarilyticus]|uniref:sugar phosphate isomerase/epimerase family protein n=1 Tax=Halococcus agarilyticus TaxID=1232219 RepID=UPI000677D9E3|nr:sugar phosphate isomerase/epimerase [Halococcus agarilyticus]
MLPIAINLYSVRALDEPLPETIDRVANAGYDGVQFSGGLDGHDPADVRSRLDDHGLDAVGPHVGVDALESDPDATARTYRDLGTDALVVPYLGPDAFESSDAVASTADRLSGLVEAFDSRGFDLHYHNHDHEFVDVDGHTAFERLFDAAPGLGAEIDVGWVATAGHDPEALLREYGDRLSLVHMKDMHTRDGVFAEIGEGDVDMAACADAAREIGADWLIYEHDDPDDPVESIDTGASFLGSL